MICSELNRFLPLAPPYQMVFMSLTFGLLLGGRVKEAKLVRCIQGAIHDIIADLRPCSPTFKKWTAVELSEENKKMIYIPEGFAHGFQTLTDNVEVFYQMSQFYSPDHARGFRWNDPSFNINWPLDFRIISPKDQSYPDFTS